MPSINKVSVTLTSADISNVIPDATTDSRARTAHIRNLTRIILGVASDDARQKLEALMRTPPYRADFFDRAEAEGAIRAKSEAIIKVLESRGIQPTAQQRELVESCTDLGQLDKWFDQALTATSATHIFGD